MTSSFRRMLIGLCTGALVVLSLLLNDSLRLLKTDISNPGACVPGMQEFTFTGSVETFEVPFACDRLHIKAWGAAGGVVQANGYAGAGGYVNATVAVDSGEEFGVVVGEGGKYGASLTSFGNGGWTCVGTNGATGGGFTGLFDITTLDLDSPGGRDTAHSAAVIVAGGGGAGADQNSAASQAGAGGGLVGQDGDVTHGKGGTQVAGGHGRSEDGDKLYGGGGGDCVTFGTNVSGAGGGYYGGGSDKGGSSWRAAGGGSSYFGHPHVLTGFTESGSGYIAGGTGDVDFSYSFATPNIDVDAADSGHGRMFVYWYEAGYEPTCGDGEVQTFKQEFCDDGNTVNGDGCNSTCKVELNYHCSGSPSVCNEEASDFTVTDLTTQGTYWHSLVGLGDIDGNGYLDFMLGHAETTGPSASDVSGSLHSYFLDAGGSESSIFSMLYNSGEPVSFGTADRGRLGGEMANMGDLDGDGQDDVVVSAHGVTPGTIQILYMDTDGSIKSSKDVTPTTGSYAEGGVGRNAVAAIGDVDGDGNVDLAVSQTTNSFVFNQEGAVWILFLDASQNIISEQKISELDGDFYEPFYDLMRFGAELEGLGDVDGDGVPDLAVGGKDYIWILLLNVDGKVKDFNRIDRDGLGQDFTLTTWGDMDGDGYVDLLTAEPYKDSGPVVDIGLLDFLFLDQRGHVLSSTELSPGQMGAGVVLANDLFGTDAINVGDLDGDGYYDLIVGGFGELWSVTGGLDFLDPYPIPEVAPTDPTDDILTISGSIIATGDIVSLGEYGTPSLSVEVADANEGDLVTATFKIVGSDAGEVYWLTGSTATIVSGTGVSEFLIGDYGNEGAPASLASGDAYDVFVTVCDDEDQCVDYEDGKRVAVLSIGSVATCNAGTQDFFFTGEIETLTIPAGCDRLEVKAWGAAGAMVVETITAGAGGYAKALLEVAPYETLGVVVGEGGKYGANQTMFGNGGATCDGVQGAGGGGFSGIFDTNNLDLDTANGRIDAQNSAMLIAAGGGGGGTVTGSAGAGGGLIGQQGGIALGGTQTEGGAGRSGGNGADGDVLLGASCFNTADNVAGGGAGYFGGGSEEAGGSWYGAAGGSSFFGHANTLSGFTDGGNDAVSGGAFDPDYSTSFAMPIIANTSDGGHGYLSLRWFDSASSPVCGDGIVTEGIEYCDDGDTDNGDGCSSTCFVEKGYYCSGAPSTCIDATGGYTAYDLEAVFPSPGDNFGASIAVFDDLNGDGNPDIMIGADRDDANGLGNTNDGSVRTIFLSSTGSVLDSHFIDLESGDPITNTNFDHFGIVVENVGDLNGDGIDDVVVGAEDGPTNHLQILYMDVDGTVKSNTVFSGLPQTGSNVGVGFASLGDLNGDGSQDYIVGANDDDDGGTNHGAMWVLFMDNTGTATGTVASSQKISDLSGGFDGGLGENANFGTAIENIGDIDNDGVVDVAVLSYIDTLDTGYREGKLWIVLLNNDGTVKSHTHYTSLGDTDFIIRDHHGAGLESLGDVDGDGVEDFAMGIPGEDDGGGNRGGMIFIYMNENGSIKSYTTLTGTAIIPSTIQNNDGFGYSIAHLGDVDGNGYPDFAIGGNTEGWTLFGGASFLPQAPIAPTDPTDDVLTISGSVLSFGTDVLVNGYSNPSFSVLVADSNEGDQVTATFKLNATLSSSVYWLTGSTETIAFGTGTSEFLLSDYGIGGAPVSLPNGIYEVRVSVCDDEDQCVDYEGGVSLGTVTIAPECGDGVVDTGFEYCDDGDTDNGDGCNSLCEVESGYYCSGAPSTCDYFVTNLTDLDIYPGGGNAYGISMAVFEDLNGDGIADLAIGDDSSSVSSSTAGALTVHFLTNTGAVSSVHVIHESSGDGLSISNSNERFSAGLTNIGDLDGDGNDDLMTGTPAGSAQSFHTLLMNANGTVKSVINALPVLGGSAAGMSVEFLGDYDNDGDLDIAIGSSRADRAGINNGAIYLASFDPLNLGELIDLNEISETSGNFGYDLFDQGRFGAEIASLGDLDGDGIGDLAVMSALEYTSTVDLRVWILLLNGDDTVKSYSYFDALGPHTLYGVSRYLGGLESWGDIDGDGVNDLVVGAPGDDEGGTDRGALYFVFLNADGSVKNYSRIAGNDVVDGIANAYRFGLSAGYLGDIDGDGYGDMAVGGYNHAWTLMSALNFLPQAPVAPTDPTDDVLTISGSVLSLAGEVEVFDYHTPNLSVAVADVNEGDSIEAVFSLTDVNKGNEFVFTGSAATISSGAGTSEFLLSDYGVDGAVNEIPSGVYEVRVTACDQDGQCVDYEGGSSLGTVHVREYLVFDMDFEDSYFKDLSAYANLIASGSNASLSNNVYLDGTQSAAFDRDVIYSLSQSCHYDTGGSASNGCSINYHWTSSTSGMYKRANITIPAAGEYDVLVKHDSGQGGPQANFGAYLHSASNSTMDLLASYDVYRWYRITSTAADSVELRSQNEWVSGWGDSLSVTVTYVPVRSRGLSIEGERLWDFGTEDFSIEFDVNLENQGDLLMYSDDAYYTFAADNGWRLQRSNQHLDFYLDDTFVDRVTIDAYDIWNRISIIRDGDVVTMYKDGVPFSTATGYAGTSFDGGSGFYLGAATAIGEASAMSGYIDDIQIYNGLAITPAIPPQAPVDPASDQLLVSGSVVNLNDSIELFEYGTPSFSVSVEDVNEGEEVTAIFELTDKNSGEIISLTGSAEVIVSGIGTSTFEIADYGTGGTPSEIPAGIYELRVRSCDETDRCYDYNGGNVYATIHVRDNLVLSLDFEDGYFNDLSPYSHVIGSGTSASIASDTYHEGALSAFFEDASSPGELIIDVTCRQQNGDLYNGGNLSSCASGNAIHQQYRFVQGDITIPAAGTYYLHLSTSGNQGLGFGLQKTAGDATLTELVDHGENVYFKIDADAPGSMTVVVLDPANNGGGSTFIHPRIFEPVPSPIQIEGVPELWDFGTDEFTIEFDLKLNSVQDSYVIYSQDYFFDLQDDLDMPWGIRIDDTLLEVWTDTYNNGPLFSYTMPLNEWKQVSLVSDSDGVGLYIDGYLISYSHGSSFGFNGGEGLYVGSTFHYVYTPSWWEIDPLDGNIDDLRILREAIVPEKFFDPDEPTTPNLTLSGTVTNIGDSISLVDNRTPSFSVGVEYGEGTDDAENLDVIFELMNTSTSEVTTLTGSVPTLVSGVGVSTFDLNDYGVNGAVGELALGTYEVRVTVCDEDGDCTDYNGGDSMATLSISEYLVLDLDMEDGGLTDKSAYGHVVSLEGNAVRSSDVQTGNGNGSLYLDGDLSSLLRVADNGAFDLDRGDWTIEFWYKHNSFGSNTEQNVLSIGSVSPGDSYAVNMATAGMGFDYIKNNSRTYRFAPAANIQNEWHHFAVVHSGSTLVTYLDGFEVRNDAFSADMIPAASDLLIGKYVSCSSGCADTSFNGYIDELKIYNGLAVLPSVVDLQAPVPAIDSYVANEVFASSGPQGFSGTVTDNWDVNSDVTTFSIENSDGDFWNGTIFDSSFATISGTNGAVVEGGAVADWEVNTNLPASYAAGAYTGTVYVVDAAGNTGSVARVFEINSIPSVDVVEVSEGEVFATGSVELCADVSDANTQDVEAIFELGGDAVATLTGSTVSSSGTSCVNTADLLVGDYTVQVQACDVFECSGLTSVVNFDVDGTDPTFAIDASINGGLYASGSLTTLFGTASEDVASLSGVVTLELDGETYTANFDSVLPGATRNWTTSITKYFATGDYTLTGRIENTVEYEVFDSVSFSVDADAPTLNFVNPSPLSGSAYDIGTLPVLTFSGTDPSTIVNANFEVVFPDDTTTLSGPVSISNGVNVSGVVDERTNFNQGGEYDMSVTVVDVVGNETTETVSFILSTPPGAGVMYVNDEIMDPLHIIGDNKPKLSVALTDPDGDDVYGVFMLSGDVNYTLTGTLVASGEDTVFDTFGASSLEDGLYDLDVKVCDENAICSEVELNRELVIDLGTPQIHIDSHYRGQVFTYPGPSEVSGRVIDEWSIDANVATYELVNGSGLYWNGTTFASTGLVALTHNSVFSGTATWTYGQFPIEFEPGTYTGTARVVDSVGNYRQAVEEFIVAENTLPLIGASQPLSGYITGADFQDLSTVYTDGDGHIGSVMIRVVGGTGAVSEQDCIDGVDVIHEETIVGLNSGDTATTRVENLVDEGVYVWCAQADDSYVTREVVVQGTFTSDQGEPFIRSLQILAATGSYEAGETFDFAVEFSEALILTGSVNAAFNTGAVEGMSIDAFATNDEVLIGTYEVQPGVSTLSFSGMSLAFDSLSLSGSSTLEDVYGNAANFVTSLQIPEGYILCDAKILYYLDEDADGFGNPDVYVEDCPGLSIAGHVINNLDQDDSDPFLHNVCVDSSECDAGSSCYGGVCVPDCNADSECASDKVCDVSVNRCVQCFNDDHCGHGQECSDKSTCISDGINTSNVAAIRVSKSLRKAANRDIISDPLACPVGLKLNEARTTMDEINAENLSFDFVWSVTKPGSYKLILSEYEGETILDEGFHGRGEKAHFIDLTDYLEVPGYAEMSRVWHERFGTSDSSFNFNDDGQVDVADYAIFYREWLKDAKSKSIIVEYDAGCRVRTEFDINLDLFIPSIFSVPRSMTISEATDVSLFGEGLQTMYYRINGGAYQEYAGGDIVVSPGDRLSYYGVDVFGISTTVIEEEYPAPIEEPSFVEEIKQSFELMQLRRAAFEQKDPARVRTMNYIKTQRTLYDAIEDHFKTDVQKVNEQQHRYDKIEDFFSSAFEMMTANISKMIGR